ncbi:Gfo/Idh/MocA family protein [Desulfonatronum thioautotrophicum]|uniref:Gfo/Idh/MocA family protein n=1 Tax=Desulfonatronum thioautotrophicum TaxID=617001 RepID=UPI00069C1BC9|nr:Gfo/Idh/MocA family oxidoreductase [Desulfonatronum thioautotrophicum]
MDVLILGFSSIVQRRVLPALLSIPTIARIHVASRSGSPESAVPIDRLGRTFREYETALSETPPCLCYISLPNCFHAVFAKRALELGFHVVLDKPATTSLADAEMLADLAARQNLCLAEATVWTHHPLAQACRDLIHEQGIPPQAVFSVFTSPPLNPDNFRYQPGLGAGALLDRGSYAVSCGRFLFNTLPNSIACDVIATTPDGQVDISFSTTLTYPNGSVLLGFFSLGTIYRNSLSIIAERYACDTERIYTPPPEYRGTLTITRNNVPSRVDVASADSFALFLHDVLHGIFDGTASRFRKVLLQDAEVLEQMLMASGLRTGHPSKRFRETM